MTGIRILIALTGTVAVALASFQAAAEEIALGQRDRVAKLFSFPNNCDSVCFLPQTLEETVAVWLRKSLERDGYDPASLSVRLDNGIVKANIPGAAGAQYGVTLPRFLQAGDKALAGAQRLLADKKWRYNWRFVLPHGLPLVNNKSVQLLHFPPDYVLEEIQDYLKAKTTERWADLLVRNGAPKSETDRYQAIVDIAPIAAPADQGKELDSRDIYGYFTPFIVDLLDLWAAPSGSSPQRPLVVFGAPASKYAEKTFGAKLDIAKYAQVKLPGGRTLDAVGSNHPSRFYNAINAQLAEKPMDKVAAVKLGMSIAKSDLIVACWQVKMSAQNPQPGADTLKTCTASWTNRDKQICQVVIEQMFVDDPEARKVCEQENFKDYVKITETHIRNIEAVAPKNLVQIQ